MGRSVVAMAVVLTLASGVAVPHVHAATILYQPGMYLVAGPAGTVFRGVDGPLYTLDPSTQQYVAHPADQPVDAGVGYFATFDGLTNVRLGADTGQPATVQAPAGKWLLVGNPSAYNDATVEGADVVYGFDPQSGYIEESTLPPGQGALVYSAQGGPITIRPLPNGIDARLSDAEDQLIDAALPLSAFPGGWAVTYITTDYGNNGNIPNAYIEQFRTRQTPKATADVQTSFVGVTLQECKDTDYAATLLTGSSTTLAKQTFGATAVNAQQLAAPPGLGDGAALFYVTTQDPSSGKQMGHQLLYFQRGTVFVTLQTNEPAGRHEQAFLLGLAQQQDQQLQAAFPS